MKTIAISIPRIRLVCTVCGKRLYKGDSYEDLNVCVTSGCIVLVCSNHTRIGDVAVQAIHFWAKGRSMYPPPIVPMPTIVKPSSDPSVSEDESKCADASVNKPK